jgi:hypothetical protein
MHTQHAHVHARQVKLKGEEALENVSGEDSVDDSGDDSGEDGDSEDGGGAAT